MFCCYVRIYKVICECIFLINFYVCFDSYLSNLLFDLYVCVCLNLMIYEKDFCLFFQVWMQTSFAKANQMVPMVTL